MEIKEFREDLHDKCSLTLILLKDIAQTTYKPNIDPENGVDDLLTALVGIDAVQNAT